MQCSKCAESISKSGRYCCKRHSRYYRAITNSLYGASYPFNIKELTEQQKIICPVCQEQHTWPNMSVDHIIPISKGGLEFDRDNLQWMCLPCNLKKHNKTEDRKQTKLSLQ